MTGCVYIITNKNNPNLIKIGCTSKTAPERAKEINRNAGLLYPCVAEYELQVSHNHELLEQKIHKLLSSKWEKKEWFKCDIENALEIIRQASKEFNFIGEIFYWVERAKIEAEHGIADAQTELAYAYYKGYGVSQDYKKAKEWFKKSANQGNAKAQNYLGLIYQNQLGLEINDTGNIKDESLLTDTITQFRLEDINISNEHIGIAKEYFEKSVSQNNAEAQFNLACLYYKGSWLAKDYKKSFELFEKAAEQGNLNAQFYLGQMYQYGHWVKRDTKQAEYWYLKAIENDENITKKVIETCLGNYHANHR
jgi:hypothetical protein